MNTLPIGPRIGTYNLTQGTLFAVLEKAHFIFYR